MTTLQESIKRALVRDKAENIKNIDCPSEEVCLIAIAASPRNLQHIKQPTPEVIFTAVLKDIHAIQYLSKEDQELVLDNLSPHFSSYQLGAILKEYQVRTEVFLKTMIERLLIKSYNDRESVQILKEVHGKLEEKDLIHFLYKNPQLIKEVDFIKKTILNKVSEKLVKENYRNIKYVPEKLHDKLHKHVMKQLPSAVTRKYFGGGFRLKDKTVYSSDMKLLLGVLVEPSRTGQERGGYLFEYEGKYLLIFKGETTYTLTSSLEEAKEVLSKQLGDLTLEFNYVFSSNAEKFILAS